VVALLECSAQLRAQQLGPWVEHDGHFCVGNHPGPPDYEGLDDPEECKSKCEESECICYDVSHKFGQWPCRFTTITSEVEESSAGYTAFSRSGSSGNASFVVGPIHVAGSETGVDPVPFRHFWNSCGWCPPDPHPLFPEYFERDDVWQNHALIGSTPLRGIRFVRIHYLLDLLAPANDTTPTACTSQVGAADGYVVQKLEQLGAAGGALDWCALDDALDSLVAQHLHPGFEIMGNPGSKEDRSDRLFTSFKNATQVGGWKDLVEALAARYIQRFGADEVAQWRFESWNEPEGQCPQQLTVGIDCDLSAFLSYWDASALGLQTAAASNGLDAPLIFGGPASDGDKSYLFALIDHCLHGVNRVDGSQGCGQPPSFLNAHLKGDQSSEAISQAELPVALKVQSRVNGTVLQHTPWGNDEADPKVGWSTSYDWRADARYAAMVPKVSSVPAVSRPSACLIH